MSFNSVEFLFFFPIVAIIYYIIPAKTKMNLRSIWLLLASYFFYMSWNAKYALLILTSTVVTYCCALLMDRAECGAPDDSGNAKRKKKSYILISVIINLGILGFFKYAQFFLDNVFRVLKLLGIQWSEPVINILLPVGISFYTFQAIGYTIDVYRGDTKAEKNFVQYALFVSFFPQLVAGPIERSKNLLVQLKEEHEFDFLNIREGLLTMLWGFFLKLVIADRAAIFIDTVYGDYNRFGGWYIVVATSFAAIRVYCDFNGYTMIAKGVAKIMGFSLLDNFDAPFLSESIGEFWRRWHMSLTGWFGDYVYFPLVKSNRVRRKSRKIRKKYGKRAGQLYTMATLTLFVWFLSGFWHGASWGYITWGVLNGFYIVMGEVLKPVKDKIVNLFNLQRSSIGHRVFCIIVTFSLYCSTIVFSRSISLLDALKTYKSMLTFDNVWIFFDHESMFECGLNRYNFELLLFAIFILLVADICKKRGISVMNVITRQNLWCRWLVYIISFIFVLVFGVWGSEYVNVAFVYFQF